MKTQFKVGDLVRIGGRAYSTGHRLGTECHHIRAGAVCEIVSKRWDEEGDFYLVRGPTRNDTRLGEVYAKHTEAKVSQAVRLVQLKPAKQAMRKRDEYANRRG